MSDFKYTKSGKKVAVIGKINSTQWIVQEVFVSGENEIPSGESFVETCLLDSPLETWELKNKKQLMETIEKLKMDISKLEEKAKIAKNKSITVSLINKAIEKYKNADISQLDTLFAFMAGEITHVVACEYHDYKILTIEEVLEASDEYCGIRRAEGLKLVTLFGCDENSKRHNDDKSFNLKWRINRYRDGSGSWGGFIYPCRSYEDAVKQLNLLISQIQKANESLINLKKKYSLDYPTQQQIEEYYAYKIKQKEKELSEKTSQIEKIQEEISSLTKDMKVAL